MPPYLVFGMCQALSKYLLDEKLQQLPMRVSLSTDLSEAHIRILYIAEN